MDIEKTPKFDLIQPNRVTSARYGFTAIQEDCLTLIIEALQSDMSKDKMLSEDMWGNKQIFIDTKELGHANNKGHVIKQLVEMRKKDIEYNWFNGFGKLETVNTGLVGAIRSVKETSKISVELSSWAIPVLTYWGKIEGSPDNGFTAFSKRVSISLKGEHAKTLYKLCCRWKDKGGFTMALDDFKKQLDLVGKYPAPKDLKRGVLNPARDRLKKGANLYFECDFEKVKSRSYNVINFKIFSNHESAKIEDNTSEWYKYVYVMLNRIYPNHQSDKAQVITDKLSENGTLRDFKGRLERLDDDVTKGKKKEADFIKLVKYCLKEDFNIK